MILHIFTDGGSRGNPGHSAIGVVATTDAGKVVYEHGAYIGVRTNNVAEYTALLSAFEWIQTTSPLPSQVQFFLDSLLVVQQMNGRFAIKDPTLKVLKQKIDLIRGSLSFPTTFTHVPRAQNARADALVNKTLDSTPQL